MSAWSDEDGTRRGAIAQLGERLLCKQEVIGSIPIGSTNFEFPNNLQSRVLRRIPSEALAL
jgi:hypothetical protein